jgi:hypothetical protein
LNLENSKLPRNLRDAANCFVALAQRIDKTWISHVPAESTFKAHIGWNLFSLTPSDASALANDIARRLLEFADGKEPSEVAVSESWEKISSQAEQIDFANFGNDPGSVARSTLEFLYFVQLRLPSRKASVDWDKVADAGLMPKRLFARLRSLEAKLTDLEPRTQQVSEKIRIIEDAHDAAERLPTDLQELQDAQKELASLLDSSRKSEFQVTANLANTEAALKKAEGYEKASAELVLKSEEAYRITTTAGLAGAFEYRSRRLAFAGWVWVFVLIVALVIAGWLGVDRLEGFKELLTGNHATSLITLNLLIAVVGVAAPVWLAWLATRNIGQSFRLSEDYAFKSAVSKAYEGYRKEAVNLDAEFAKRLFGSALNRLDEAPSRFMSREDQSSPLEALLANTEIKEMLKSVPSVSQKIMEVILEQKAAISGALATGAAVAASSAAPKRGKTDAGKAASAED